ncbi:MAG: hypothetical protein QOC95_369 [Thermoleophilaceae bacterium]|jgi:SAM-dependent methyltransferase|nr:hypothetical protein [Thermoleophilaceae bacterium]
MLWRTSPVSTSYGFDRGTPIDRAYIERFLASHAEDVRGRVLEIQDDAYTRRFGGSRVVRSDVLHVDDGHAGVTIVGDLCAAGGIGEACFDCIVLTQTLSFLPDIPAALKNLHRSLAPAGVLLVTSAGLSRICTAEDERWGHFWNLTPRSVALLLTADFGAGAIEVETYGNVLAATCFLQGLAAEELSEHELEFRDARYPVIVAARATKAGAGQAV